MNINQFNRQLTQISKVYLTCQQLKLKLKKLTPDQILESINDKYLDQVSNNKLNLDKSRILQWINEKSSKSSAKYNNLDFNIEHINNLLPFSKISYTTLTVLCLKGLVLNEENIPKAKKSEKIQNIESPVEILIEIIRYQIIIECLKKQIIPLIELYIPMSQKNLTLEELKDYLLLDLSPKTRQINAMIVILALNGNSNSTYLEYEFYSSLRKSQVEEKQQLIEEDQQQQSQIQQIMARLNKRVDNFGNQWLINKPYIGSQKKQ